MRSVAERGLRWPGRRKRVVAYVAALSPLLAQCILVISPATGSTTCQLTGESSLCSSCAQASCQSEIDACCADTTCTALSDLEACSSQHGETCTRLQAGSEPGVAGSSLASCIAESCRGDCQPFTGQGTTSCSEPPFAQGTACSCQLPDANDPVNDFVCSTAVYPGTLCCAPMGWPGPGLACACNVLGCDPSPGGCECQLANYTPMGQDCQTPHCCAYEDTCSCGSAPCYTYETTVESCSIAAVACPPGEQQVASCSILSP